MWLNGVAPSALTARRTQDARIGSTHKMPAVYQRSALQPLYPEVNDQDPVFNIGKYVNMRFSEVRRLHPDYASWAKSQPNPFGQIKEFVTYCIMKDAFERRAAIDKLKATYLEQRRAEDATQRSQGMAAARRAEAERKEAEAEQRSRAVAAARVAEVEARIAARIAEEKRRAEEAKREAKRQREEQRIAAHVAEEERKTEELKREANAEALRQREEPDIKEATARSLADQLRRSSVGPPPPAPTKALPPAPSKAPAPAPPTKAPPPAPFTHPVASEQAPARVSVASLGLADGDAIEVLWHIQEENGIEMLNVWWLAHVRLDGCSPTSCDELTLSYATMHGFDAEERTCCFLEDEDSFPDEGSLLDITYLREARLHWRRAQSSAAQTGRRGGVSASQSAAAIPTPGMCRASCANGKPCRNRVHKNAGKAPSHRAHTCGVHKGFTGDLLQDFDDTSVMARECGQATPATRPPRDAPPPVPPPPPFPPPPADVEEPAEATGEAAKLREKLRAAEERARKRSLEVRQRTQELQLQLLKEREERQAEQQRAAAAGAVAEVIAAPLTWTPFADATAMQKVPVPRGGDEWNRVVGHFRSSASCCSPHAGSAYVAPELRDIRVQRIQNHALWQPYQLKRREVMKREKVTEEKMSRYERLYLYHGTDAPTAAKIASAGFNRSFSGKNASRLGKGVYFALNAGYSIAPQYATPDEHGDQHVFCCRVLVGEYAVGAASIPAPPVRRVEPHLLFDSTVDRLTEPEIFVTFHDASSYPEYLITFRPRSRIED